jgi:hypothetical protein
MKQEKEKGTDSSPHLFLISHKINTLINVLLKLRNQFLKQLLFKIGYSTHGMYFLNTFRLAKRKVSMITAFLYRFLFSSFLTPKSTRLAKNRVGAISDSTKVHSEIPDKP